MIEIKNITKSYPGFNLDISSLSIGSGDYIVLVGDSGSGKSLFLEILSGLIKPDSGSILVDQHEIVAAPINRRPFGLLFQDQTLFPHMSVRKNISYPLKYKSIGSVEIAKRVQKVASMVEAEHILDRFPGNLSGGEKQRVSLARTLITQPRCLLLDEPLTALDASLKKEVRALLRWLNRKGITILHVTHDYDEAISLASHIGVMHKGTLHQFGTTEYILKQPRSSFVANFAGIHNYFKVDLRNVENGGVVAITEAGVSVRISTEKTGGNGYIIIPCESIVLSVDALVSSAGNQFRGIVKEITPARFGVEIRIDSEIPLVAQVTQEGVRRLNPKEGQQIWASFKASSVQFIKK